MNGKPADSADSSFQDFYNSFIPQLETFEERKLLNMGKSSYCMQAKSEKIKAVIDIFVDDNEISIGMTLKYRLVTGHGAGVE